MRARLQAETLDNTSTDKIRYSGKDEGRRAVFHVLPPKKTSTSKRKSNKKFCKRQRNHVNGFPTVTVFITDMKTSIFLYLYFNVVI